MDSRDKEMLEMCLEMVDDVDTLKITKYLLLYQSHFQWTFNLYKNIWEK